MNFFGHAVIAGWRSNDPAHALGAMLPDFATMSRAKLHAVSHPQISAGVSLHHRSDGVFHAAATFRRMYRNGIRELSERGVPRGGAMGAAHIGVELLFDGALVADTAAGRLYEQALHAAAAPEVDGAIEWREPTHRNRWRTLRDTLAHHGVPHDYADPDIVAERVVRILSTRPRLALDDASQYIVAEWLRATRCAVHNGAEMLLGEVRTGLAAR